MNYDDINSVVLAVAEWIEQNRGTIDCVSFDHPVHGDKLFDSLSEVIHGKLERFETKERNYN